MGRFRSLGSRPQQQKWFVPSAFPWPRDFSVDEQFWNRDSQSATQKYAALWQHVESQARCCVPFVVNHNSFGRGQTLATKSAFVGSPSPLRAARKGEFEPHFHGVSKRHCLWVRQVRRLQAYVRLCSSPKHNVVPEQAAQMWFAIIRARGFDPSFVLWWESCSFHTHGAPVTCPNFPPLLPVANAMFETLY